MGYIVLAPYRVKKENQSAFFEVVKEKRKYFTEKGFMTARVPIFLQSRKDEEVFIDIFEWTSEEHIDKAHEDEGVRKLWTKMAELWVNGGFKLNTLQESKMNFPNFIPVDL